MPPDPTAEHSEDRRGKYRPWTVSAQPNCRCDRAVRISRWRCTKLSLLRAVHHRSSVHSRDPLGTLAANISLLPCLAEGAGN